MDIVERALAEFGTPEASKTCGDEDGTDVDDLWAHTPDLWSPGQMKLVESSQVMSPKFSAGKSHQQMINASKKNKKGKKEKNVDKKDEKQEKVVKEDGEKKKGVKKDEKKKKGVKKDETKKKGKMTEAEKQSPAYQRRKFQSKAYHNTRKRIMEKLGDKVIATQQAKLAHREAGKMWDEMNEEQV